MSNLFASGVRPAVDDYLLELSKERRNYGNYWSASSAGYCLRKNIFERLKLPYTTEDARKQRVFSVGNIFHKWLQDITKEAGLSIAQELELQDEELMIRGHIDDLVLVNDRLMLIDYKTAHSRSFTYSKGRPMSHYHKLQLGTYMHMLRGYKGDLGFPKTINTYNNLSEARILTISKDDLRMDEKQLLWSEELSSEVRDYWTTLNQAWETYNKTGELPSCGCADHENGFMAKEQWNPFFKHGEPCSEQYFKEWLKETNDAE